jgi:hypothetical protein
MLPLRLGIPWFVKLAERQPILNWLRRIPIAAKPPHVVVLEQQYFDAAAYHHVRAK